MRNKKENAKHLPTQTKPRERFVVLVSGASGSGKSTLTKKLADALKAPIVHQDNFFKGGSAKNVPYSILYKKAVDDRVERPDFIEFNGIIEKLKTFTRTPDHTLPTVFVEGHSLLSNDDLVSMADLILYLSCQSIDTALKRREARKQRDAETNFYLVRYYRQFVWPAHQKYIIPKLHAIVARKDPRLHMLRAEDSVDSLVDNSLAIISESRK